MYCFHVFLPPVLFYIFDAEFAENHISCEKYPDPAEKEKCSYKMPKSYEK
jgi:hypothetical protein